MCYHSLVYWHIYVAVRLRDMVHGMIVYEQVNRRSNGF